MTYGGYPDQHSQGAAPPPPPGFGPPPPGFGPPMPVPVQAPYGGPVQPPYGGPVQPPYDGPEFLVHDRVNSVIVDANGVALEVQGHTMEFPWPAIRTVHHAPAPHGTVLMVAVAHADGMLYECRIAARRQAVLHQWLGELGSVLQFYLANRPPVY
ncbi:hypothetical protein ACWGI8_00170 [Streptomyces sp. NPDC054841]